MVQQELSWVCCLTDDPLTYFKAVRLQAKLQGRRPPRGSMLVTAFFNRVDPAVLVRRRRRVKRKKEGSEERKVHLREGQGNGSEVLVRNERM